MRKSAVVGSGVAGVVGVAGFVAVLVGVWVTAGELVGVAVAAPAVDVLVGVCVGVLVAGLGTVAVGVFVAVGVCVGVPVAGLVAVAVAGLVGVDVMVGVGVLVGVGVSKLVVTLAVLLLGFKSFVVVTLAVFNKLPPVTLALTSVRPIMVMTPPAFSVPTVPVSVLLVRLSWEPVPLNTLMFDVPLKFTPVGK